MSTNLSNNPRICQTLGIVNKNNESTFSTLDKYVKSKLDSSKKFNISLISENQVFKLLNKLNSSKSAGVDTVGPRILKLAAPVINRAIAHIINTSIKQGIFPDELKKAKVSPIFKSGDNETVTCRRVTHPSTDRARCCLTSDRSRASQPHHQKS